MTTKKRAEDLTIDDVMRLYNDPNIKKYDMKNPEEREQFYKDTASPYRPKQAKK